MVFVGDRGLAPWSNHPPHPKITVLMPKERGLDAPKNTDTLPYHTGDDTALYTA